MPDTSSARTRGSTPTSEFNKVCETRLVGPAPSSADRWMLDDALLDQYILSAATSSAMSVGTEPPEAPSGCCPVPSKLTR